jgi:signal transduction histidine kinase
VLISGVGGWWLAGEALRPVEHMRRQAADMSERDDEAQLVVPPTRDELAALATTMNAMLDRLRAALRHERGFVADAGHELRTPLATLRAELELACRPGRDREELQTAVHEAAEETERIIRLAEDLLLLARGEEDRGFLRREATDLGEIAATAARAAAVRGAARGVTVSVEGPVHLALTGDPDRLRQALDNVLTNAVHHSPDNASVTLRLREPPEGTAGAVVLTVADEGSGFPPEFLPHAFERFRRADTARARAGGGTGLGLAIVETIVRAHHGRVRATNQDGGGAVVEIVLPRDGEPGVAAAARDEVASPAR